jgi:hypothetical protein
MARMMQREDSQLCVGLSGSDSPPLIVIDHPIMAALAIKTTTVLDPHRGNMHAWTIACIGGNE